MQAFEKNLRIILYYACVVRKAGGKVYRSSRSMRSLASGACFSIFSGKPNIDTQAMLSPPAFGASAFSCLLAKSISRRVSKMPSKSTSPSPMAGAGGW